MRRLPWVRRGQGWPREMMMGEERGKEARERARRKERKRSKHCRDSSLLLNYDDTGEQH